MVSASGGFPFQKHERGGGLMIVGTDEAELWIVCTRALNHCQTVGCQLVLDASVTEGMLALDSSCFRVHVHVYTLQ